MISSQEINDLLLVLNTKSIEKDIVYSLKYEMVYSRKYKKVYKKSFVLKFSNNKLLHKFQIYGGEAGVLKVLCDELKLYTPAKNG